VRCSPGAGADRREAHAEGLHTEGELGKAVSAWVFPRPKAGPLPAQPLRLCTMYPL
jgi:hypothetical protein